MEAIKCPACERGEIVLGQCQRCKVVIASGSLDPWPRNIHARHRRRQDQDSVRPITDYLRTKEDK